MSGIDEDLQHWVNDGLMALFFFVVGLEIERELVDGELSDRRAATLPALAARPARSRRRRLRVLAGGGAAASGWAIPMATDIAFAVGVLAVLGDRVSDGVKLLVLAIAVVDDIIAIAVIAVFYSDRVQLGWLAAALAAVGLIVVLRRAGVTRVAVYIPVGVALWVATLESGVHATVAGVVLGLLTPAGLVGGRPVLEQLEHRLHPMTSFVVVPLFALANAGVYLGGGVLSAAAVEPRDLGRRARARAREAGRCRRRDPGRPAHPRRRAAGRRDPARSGAPPRSRASASRSRCSSRARLRLPRTPEPGEGRHLRGLDRQRAARRRRAPLVRGAALIVIPPALRLREPWPLEVRARNARPASPLRRAHACARCHG